jgi:hypothetical protein
MCVGTLWIPAARTPLSLLALLNIGGLFAYFGQTYQTGADPWQLFSLWAALSLPLCLSVRGEGEAQQWAKAKYGEFRIGGNGRALLMGPRGPDLEEL